MIARHITLALVAIVRTVLAYALAFMAVVILLAFIAWHIAARCVARLRR